MLAVGLLLGVAALTGGPTAQAQVKEAALARIRLLNSQAMEDYDGLEFDSAKTKLLEALSVAEGASLGKSRQISNSYINLGIVYGAGFNNRIKAIEAFTKALQNDRDTKLDPARATPALDEMFKAAQGNVAAQPPEPTVVVRHEPLQRALQGRRLVVRAAVTESNDVARVLLFYRGRRGLPFARVPMRSRGGARVAIIPGRRVRPPVIEYYIEVQDDDGERVAGSGSQQSPLRVTVRPRERGVRGAPKTLSLAVMVGTGGGIVFGGASEHLHPRASGPLGSVDIKPGAALAPMHLALEVGYHLTRLWRLSALARLQLLTLLNGVSIASPNPISFVGIARAKRYFGLGMVQPFLSFGAGGGQIRHRIALGDYDPNEDPTGTLTPNNIVDARTAGYGVLAFGGGVDVMFNQYFGIVVDGTGMLLIPDFAAHLDLNLGIIVSF